MVWLMILYFVFFNKFNNKDDEAQEVQDWNHQKNPL